MDALRSLARFRPAPPAVDRALAVLLALDAVIEAAVGADGGGHRLWVALAAPAVTLPIAVRRRFPALVGAGIPVVSVYTHAYWGPQAVAYPIAEFCALYALAVWTPTRRFLLGTVLFVAAAYSPWLPAGDAGTGALFVVVIVISMVLARRVVGDRERRAELAEREREVATREAIVEERARIARELHDAIAHNVSMIVVQAGAERRVLDAANASTREVLATIEEIGRSALTEMRRLVGMLRSDAVDPLAPQPGLGDLPRLAEQVREAGLPVDLRVVGEPRPLPVGIELSAYRIVQEALTNALKHAGEARAAVHVRYGAESLELEILDDGGGAPAPAAVGGGHGLAGMRERVALYGGRFDAGRLDAGGFGVRVLLPIR